MFPDTPFPHDPIAHPLDIDEAYIEDKGCMGWYDGTYSCTAITQVGRDGDPSSLPQAHASQTSVHACDDPALTQSHNVWCIVVKTKC